MNVGNIAIGAGLAGWGIALFALSRWYVRDDARLLRAAKSRWWLDRRQRKIRSGEVSQEEWFTNWIRGQRAMVKWVATPFLALWLIICVGTIVHGFANR